MKRRWKGRFIKEGKKTRLENLSENLQKDTEDSVCPENNKQMRENHENKEPEVSAKSGWGEGRQIVELAYLAEQMKHCKNCEKPLLLHNISQEKRCGYASILYIDCSCGIVNAVHTGRSHRPQGKSKAGMPVYDINTKAVLGVIHAGLTYRQMNGLMTTMEIKGVHPSAMIRRQQEVQSSIEETARESCSEMLREEQ